MNKPLLSATTRPAANRHRSVHRCRFAAHTPLAAGRSKRTDNPLPLRSHTERELLP